MKKWIISLLVLVLSFGIISLSKSAEAATTPKMVKFSSKMLNGSVLFPSEIASKIYTKEDKKDKTWYFYYKGGKKDTMVMYINKHTNYFYESEFINIDLIKFNGTNRPTDIVAGYLQDMPYLPPQKEYYDTYMLSEEMPKYILTYESTTSHSSYKFVNLKNYNGTWTNQSSTNDKTFHAVSLQFINSTKAKVVISSNHGSLKEVKVSSTVTFNKNGVATFTYSRGIYRGKVTLFLSNKVFVNVSPYEKEMPIMFGNNVLAKKVSKIPNQYPRLK